MSAEEPICFLALSSYILDQICHFIRPTPATQRRVSLWVGEIGGVRPSMAMAVGGQRAGRRQTAQSSDGCLLVLLRETGFKRKS